MTSFRQQLAEARAEAQEREPPKPVEAPADLLAFLSDVLPSTGPVYFGAYTAPNEPWRHFASRTVSQFADDLAHYDDLGYEVYFAPACFADEGISDSTGKLRRRVRENVRFINSFWLDIDVGDGKAANGKGYASLDLAIAAVGEFASKIECGNPTYQIGSGTGLHCYWAFEKEISVQEWNRVALDLKRACAATNLLADPARTADATSVMRPVGTHHRKDPSNPRVVRILAKGAKTELKSFSTNLAKLVHRLDSGRTSQIQTVRRDVRDATEWLQSLPEQAQLQILDDACSLIPDAKWSEYDSWIKIIAALRGIRGVREASVLELIEKHSARSSKWAEDRWNSKKLQYKFRSFHGGSIYPLLEIAAQHGWKPPRRRKTPFEANEREIAEQYLTSSFIYVSSQHMYFDASSKDLISPAALDESQFHMTQQLGSTPRKLLKSSRLTERVNGIGYHPGTGIIYDEDGRRFANVYVPWVPEEIDPNAEEKEIWDWFINEQLFSEPNDDVIRDYFLDAIAYPLQHPGRRVASIPLLIGAEPGTGKSTLTETVPRQLFGPKNVSTVTQAEIESSFNDWQAGCLILCLPEIWIGGHRDSEKLANRLKDSVTNPVIRIHPKGLKGYSQVNRTTTLATSNYENAVALQDGDRRWGVHVTSASKMLTADARRLYKFLDSERAPGVLRRIFLSRDLSGFNPFGAPPLTEGKSLVIAASRSDAEDTIIEAHTNNEYPFDRDLVVLEDIRDLLAGYRIDISLRKIGDFIRRPPISAVRLSARPRLNARRKTPLEPHGRSYEGRKSVWAIRNASAWSSASESVISDHFASSSPPISEPVIPNSPRVPTDSAVEQDPNSVETKRG